MMKNIDFGNYRDKILFQAILNGNSINNEQLEELQEGFNEIERSKFQLELNEMLDNMTLAKAEKIQGLYLVTTLGKMVADEGGFNVFRLPIEAKTKKEKDLIQDKSELIESLLETNKRFVQSIRDNRITQNISTGVAIGGLIALIIQIYLSIVGITNVKGSIEIVKIEKVDILETKANLLAKKVDKLQTSIDSLENLLTGNLKDGSEK